MRLTSAFGWLTLVASGLLGCTRNLSISSEIGLQRDSTPALATLHDFEIGRSALQSRLGALERLHFLDSDNDDLLFLLTESWGVVTYSFTEDDFEAAAELGDEPLTRYQLDRAKAGYERALYYAVELLEHEDEDFSKARTDAGALRTWLAEHYTDAEDAPLLVGLARAWLRFSNLSGGLPARAGSADVGVALAERALKLDEHAAFGSAHVLLGAYYGEKARLNRDKAQQHLARALELENRRYLPALLELAHFACASGNRADYERALHEVVRATDPLPAARFDNVVAKRRAARYLSHAHWGEACK